VELGYCQACGTRNGPEATKCGKCGIAIINLDRSSNIVQGLRSGVLAGVVIGLVDAILSALFGAVTSNDVTGAAVAGVFLFIWVFICWIVKGVIIGAIAGLTNSLCYYRNASGIGAIIGGISVFLFPGCLWLSSLGLCLFIWGANIAVGGALGSLASYIERKYFRKMSWL